MAASLECSSSSQGSFDLTTERGTTYQELRTKLRDQPCHTMGQLEFALFPEPRPAPLVLQEELGLRQTTGGDVAQDAHPGKTRCARYFRD
jgi:hypothetical protein